MPLLMLGRTGQGVLTFLALYLTLGSIYVSTRNQWAGWALLVLLIAEVFFWLRRRRQRASQQPPHQS